MTNRVAIYARVSSVEQSKGYSLDTQIEACQAYAREHGWSVVAGLCDNETGHKLDRPGLDKLRDLASSGKIDGILVYELDRLARRMVYQLLLETEFEKLGVSIHYILGDYADSDEGRLQKQIRAAIAEYERAKIAERATRGRRGKAKAGYMVLGGSKILGYQVKREPHKAWLEVDEEEARIVRLIFHWYAYGDEDAGPMSLAAIARRLTAMSIPTKADRESHMYKVNGPGKWGRSTIAGIIDNTTYIGTWYYNRTQWINRKAAPRPREEWIPVEVPRIIDDDLWKAAQERRRKNAERSRRNRKREYLLVSHLGCTRCGSRVGGKTLDQRKRGGKVYQYYRCGGLKDEGPGRKCDLPFFRLEQVDTAVWNWVESILLDPERLAEELRAQQVEAQAANETLYERLALVESQIEEQERKLEKVLDLYLQDGDFPKAVLDDKKAAILKIKADLEEERTRLEAHLEASVITTAQVQELEAFCALVCDGLEHITFEGKRRILDLLDVEGLLAIENGEKVIHLRCVVDSTRFLVESTATCDSDPASGI